MPTPHSKSSIATFRAFNRFYTTLIGSLSKAYLETPYSLQEARVIFEVATDEGCTAKDVQSRAGFNQAYLSRLISRLTEAGLITRTQSAKDGRAQQLALTAAGKRAFTTLNERADTQASRLLSHLNSDQTAELCQAFGTIRCLLDSTAPAEPLTIRAQRVGDLGWLFQRHAVVYTKEFGYRNLFEEYVCEGLAPYLKDYNPRLDGLWIAEIGGRAVGSIAVHHVMERPTWAKLRWLLVEREARGRGAGSKLLAKAIAFCAKAGYRGVFLWTVSDLDSARRLYEKAGFALVEEKESCAWAPWAREQCWELLLQNRESRH